MPFANVGLNIDGYNHQSFEIFVNNACRPVTLTCQMYFCELHFFLNIFFGRLPRLLGQVGQR